MVDGETKVVLITGCSSGIGHAAALLLSKDPDSRFKVYATMRNLAKKDELEKAGEGLIGKTLFIEKLDVSSEDEINTFVDNLLGKEKRIDILVNNAGIGWFGPLEDHPTDNARAIFNTNVFGPMMLIKKILPHWKAHDYGHAIVISSVCGIAAFPFSAVINSSKFAIEGYFESLALECMNFKGIKISIIEPGPVATKFGENNGVQYMEEHYKNSDPVTSQTMKKMFANVGQMFQNNVQSSDNIAKVILMAVTDSNPHLRYSTNSFFDETLKTRYTDLQGDKALQAICQFFHG